MSVMMLSMLHSNSMKTMAAFMLALGLLVGAATAELTLHVHPGGSDAALGTPDAPMRTIHQKRN